MPGDAGLAHRAAGEATARALVEGYLDPRGILSHGCYNNRLGLATQHELNWGTYYLYEALNVLAETLEPARI